MQPRPARRRRLLVAAALLAVLGTLAAVDTGARWWAQDRIADRLAEPLAQRGVDDVHVRLGGPLAVPQLLRHRADHLRVSARLPFDALGDLAAHGLPTDPGRAADVRWSEQDGLLVAATDLHRRRFTVPVTVAWALSADDGDLTLAPQTVTVAGARVPASRAGALLPDRWSDVLAARRVDVATRLPSALDGARLTSVAVEPDGVRIALDLPPVPLDDAAPTGAAAPHRSPEDPSCTVL